ncbi:AraC family transcriptional regulator [uncultured Litoreibacter sp.]|uniref:helix-turn-helix domain-containing protein n=1 Tax=uncultured Litoreibacter sp. TaxID=1392394 RepID=UPI00260C997E|nr:AraC family transcriptional regulator [uncultured Litoreibacter sp.]
MGRLSTSDTPIAPFVAAGGTLTLAYCEGGPGRKTAETEHHHCLVVPAQDTPMRVIATRDGIAQQYTLNRGDIALATQGSHTLWEWLDHAKVILIKLDPAALLRFIEHEMRLMLTGNTLENEVVVTDPDLSAAAFQLHAASRQNGVGGDILLDALARVFLVTLVRRYGTYDTHGPAGFGLDDYVLILDHIEARLDAKITPARLAQLVGMSEATFGRKFKQRTGQSPMAFVKEARLRAALVHLHEGQLSLGEIAIRCGFADQAHFSRVFRTEHGRSPGKYRAALRA